MSSQNNKNLFVKENGAWSSQLATNITIDHNTANQRLDRFLRKYFRPYPDISLVMIFKAIRTGQIKIATSDIWAISDKLHLPAGRQGATEQDDLKLTAWSLQPSPKKVSQSYSLKIGDTIIFHSSFLDLLSNKNPVEKKARLPLSRGIEGVNLAGFQSRIISEDDNRLVINKPAGISIHPWQKIDNWKLKIKNNSEFSILNSQLSLYDLIKQYYSSRGFAGSMFQPNVAYRLDKDTSWLVIVAKTYPWLQYLNEQIRNHNVDKEYYAIAIGTFPKQLTMNKPMKKIVDKQFGRGKMIICSSSDEHAQEAHTIGYVEKSRSDPVLGPLSLVKVKITTGRMHQIRVHMADAWYPVLGDIVYGVPSHNRKLQKTYWFLRQCLHCFQYSFNSQDGQYLSFQAPLLDDMKKVM